MSDQSVDSEDSENVEWRRDTDDEGGLEDTGDFLAEFESTKYVPKPSAEDKQLAKAQAKEAREQVTAQAKYQRDQIRQAKLEHAAYKKAEVAAAREAKKASKMHPIGSSDDTDSIFGDSPTPIHGRDRILLIKKINQYKALFPAELKTFKIKKNPSAEDLTNVLAEMEVLVETNSVDGFLVDSVLQCIKMVEPLTSGTRNYDVRGLADMLKANKDFHRLAKQLFIKYNVFSSVPVEYQMVMLVSTTAFIATQKNKGKASIDSYLDETI